MSKIIIWQREEYTFRKGVFEDCGECPMFDDRDSCPHAAELIDCTVSEATRTMPHQQYQLKHYTISDMLSDL